MNSKIKEQLRLRIKSLDVLTNEERSQLLELLAENKPYGLVWEDKPEDVEERLREELPVLKEVPERAIISDNPDAPNHILIEGDNLEALTALAYTHEGKIDVIYIDPPYNTGNKDFVYNDHYVDKDDSYRHSKWLSFMSRRLKIAKQLLSEKGVIFISIDDNEQANLKLLCDEIFGRNNFLASVVQKSRDSISGDLLFSPNHNYLLVYSLKQSVIFTHKDDFRIPSVVNAKLFKNPDNDPRGPWKLNPVDGPGGERKGNPYYTFLGITGYYRYSKEMMQKYYEDGLIIKRKNSLGKKYFLSQALSKKGNPPTTWWDDAGTTTNGTKLLQKILPDVVFNNPKPIELIIRCLQLMYKNATILDFFAGSGTTLHATMQLNKVDGGHRKCILVTNNENGICENVTYERNKRVIEGYTTPKGEQVAGLTDNNLRYYRTDFVGRSRSVQNMRRLVNLSTDMLCIKEDLHEEQREFAGQQTYKNVFRYFDNGQKRMLVIYREEAVEQLVRIIAQTDLNDKIKVYVFSPSEDPWEETFEEVADKVELCALPAAIYNAYRRVLPKQRDEIIGAGETERGSQTDGMLNFTD